MEGPQSSTHVPLLLPLLLLLPLGPAWQTAAQGCPQTCICDNSRLHVACRHQNLTEVPNTIPELTQRLDLQGNMLKVIPPAAFQALPYLTHLDLRHCQVELVAEGAFRGLGRLLLLNLGSNRLSSLPQEALDGLGSLRRLELERNMLEELRPGTFGALGALATLNLAHNALVYLPAMAFQGLLRARWLQLSHNALSVLAPEALAGLPALRRLSLNHNELQALPGAALSQAHGLARLELGHNPLTYTGEEDGLALPGLRELTLDHGALQALGPRAFAHCPRLHTLDLRGNQLDTLPALQGPGQLRRLRLQGNPLWCGCQARPLLEWLARARVRSDGACRGPRRLRGEALDALRPSDLRCPGDAAEEEEEERAGSAPRAPTRAPQEEDGAATPCPRACVCAAESRHSSCEGRGLQAVPRGFPNGTQLLDLRRNHFPSVPRAAFPGLGHLVSLHLQHCGIAELEAGALAGLGRLLYLYLSDNQLSGLSAAALEGAPHLGYLYLERNRFLQVPGAALRALPSLFSLHLQDNAVEHLAPGDLAGVRALRWLYLSGNRITQVSPGALGTARELEKLYLDRNQLREVPTGALEGLPALLELQLSGNPLRALQDGNFRPVGRSLQHLFLNSSDLEQISPEAFSGLELGLQSLHLQKNQLRALPALPNLRQLELIDLSGNPFHCDCQLLPMHRWLAGLNLRVGATCTTPPSARGQRVKAAAAVFRACPGWAARKARWTPTFMPGGRRTPIKRRQQEADKALCYSTALVLLPESAPAEAWEALSCAPECKI
ncbi:chondroadherin-like protein isoform X1 [Ictidomys tridecemlineatus]|uniref:chondroadherin-like protein isoform X1 n=1 Tax=Ictidomys tridecemlineatus TaxID=43179 RepID=UPI000B542F65|nr:chondroadherin-like protein isoform X1 [Ictidomys tridecemlineatus]KAG3290869.1 chondroadherin like, transcript variant X1 [Ictidomys tridecemlineatus]